MTILFVSATRKNFNSFKDLGIEDPVLRPEVLRWWWWWWWLCIQ